MIENLMPLNIPPGFFANGTKYQAAGRWTDGNLVRFHEGTIQPVGGWLQHTTTGAAIVGTPLAAISWQLADGTPYLAVGTDSGLYVIDDNDVVYDVTPDPATMHAAPYDWQLSTFGAYLVAVNSLRGDDDLALVNTYTWTGDTAALAAAAWTTDVGPRGAYAAFATPERFLTVLRGLDPTTEPARSGVDTAYSERRVYWASQEELVDFVSTDTNTGGNFDLSTDGRLVVGAAARGQSLLWTDVDLWTMTYIGGELIYSFANAGRQCGIVSRRGFVMLDQGAYWMGRGKFYVYDGYVRSIPCEVTDAVFGDFEESRAHTVWSLVNPRYNEATWFYPAAGSLSPDRYVTFNYVEGHWTYGTLARSAGVSQRFTRDVNDAPLPVMFDGATLFDHETGGARDSQAYLTSGPIELGAGDRLMRLLSLVPDDRTEGDVQARIYTALVPDALETLNGPYTLTAVTPLRLTARQVRVRLEETGADSWRVGTVRLGVRAAERRGTGTSTTDFTAASLEIIPSAVALVSGQHYTFTAIVRNAAGEVLALRPNAWTSDAPASVSVNSSGTVTVLAAPATVHIQAHITALGLNSNIATVTTTPRSAASLTIETDVTVGPGATVQLHPVVRDALGVILTDQVVTWDSDDETEATVDSAGLVTGVASSGTCNVHAHVVAASLNSNACVVTCAEPVHLHSFPDGGSLTVTSSGDINVLLVGGGGDADGLNGGGGGGVALYTVTVVSGQTYAIEVGVGGQQSRFGHAQFTDTYVAGGGQAASSVRGGLSGSPQGNFGGSPSGFTTMDGGGGNGGGAGGGAGGNGGDALVYEGPGGGPGGVDGGHGGNSLLVIVARGPMFFGGGGGGGGDGVAIRGTGGDASGGDGVVDASGNDGIFQTGGGGGGGTPGGVGAGGAAFVWYPDSSGVVASGGTESLH